MKQIKLKNLKPAYKLQKNKWPGQQERHTVRLFVPDNRLNLHKPKVAASIAELFVETPTKKMEFTNIINLEQDVTQELSRLIGKGWGKSIGNGVYRIFVGPLAGEWVKERRYVNAVYPWNWSPPKDFYKRVDPWLWFTTKPETRKHLEDVLSYIAGGRSGPSGELRLRAFVRTFLTKGAKVALKRLFPLMHPATRNLFLRVSAPLCPRFTYSFSTTLAASPLRDLRSIRRAHKDFEAIRIVAAHYGSGVSFQGDRNYRKACLVDELVSRFGIQAYRAWDLFEHELHRAISILSEEELQPYKERAWRIEPSRLWQKWHDEIVTLIAAHHSAKDKATQKARQDLWDWVLGVQAKDPSLFKGMEIRPLITWEQMLAEHKEMGHCIHTYGASTSLLGHVRFLETGEEATFEIVDHTILWGEGGRPVRLPNFYVAQCYGVKNSEVSKNQLGLMSAMVKKLSDTRIIESSKQQEVQHACP